MLVAKSNVPITENLLIAGTDPDPVEWVNRGSSSPFLLVCEHGGRAIPQKLGNLGLPQSKLNLHIAYDIGAEKVAKGLAEKLGSSLIVQRYSRLVIDCNRPPGTPESIPEASDSIEIPANKALSTGNRDQREQAIFAPYASRCKTEIACASINFAYSIHSFEPTLHGQYRPWDIGFLYRHQSSCGEDLAALFIELWPELLIGLNEPYRIEDLTDWFIPVCAEDRGIPHCLIEIRNDLLGTEQGCQLWVDRLYQLFTTFKEQIDATNP